jgi:CubicO group peptidase (beta-lactamase class C family)
MSLVAETSPSALARAGIAPDRLAVIDAALTREVDERRMPGAVVAIMRRGQLVYAKAIGSRDPATREPLAPDAIFSIASMTKPMTSVAAMMLVEEGRLLLADPVAKYLPAFASVQVARSLEPEAVERRAPASPPTIQDLLRHTSGLTYRDRGTSAAHKQHPPGVFVAAAAMSSEEFVAKLAAAPLLFDPGTNWEYGTSTDVLGFVVETIAKQPLETVLAERIWKPLGMVDTSFALPAAKRSRYAHALPNDPLTGQAQTVVHAHPISLRWGPGGAAALSTAADYLRFAEMLRLGGTLDGRRLLGPKTVAYMTSDHLPAAFGNRIADAMDPAAAGYGFGLGFAVRRQAGIAAMPGSTGDYYWSGVFGTYFWVDPVEELSVVAMMAVPGLLRMRYRQLMRGLVYQALVQ